MSSLFRKQICILIFLIFFQVNLSLFSLPPNDRYSSDTTRYGLLNQRSPVGKEYISLLPGFQYRSSNLIVSSPIGSKLRMPDEETNETKFFMDIKSRDYHFGSVWGAFLLYQNIDFDLTKQSIDKPYTAGLNVGSSIYASNNRVNQIGTELKGNITSLMPVFYIGDREKEFFRMGIGIGPSKVYMKGNPDFYNGWSEEAPVLALIGNGQLSDKIDRFGDFALIRNGKTESDPINALLLSNLSQPGNLDLFGIYQYSKGNIDITKTNLYTMYLINQLTEGSLTPLQIVSLATVGRSDFKLKEKYVSSFYFFFEIPFYDVTFRFGYGGPIYYQENYRVTFRNVDISVFIPIDI
ncbi:MAG: hypothetical protein SH817_14750 [Leptospira sp.]|nr:hypothetical protein [Leptospira sp.]